MNKKEKFQDVNPWAICTAQVGRDSPNYEKCVMDVKKQYGLSEDMTEEDFKAKLPVYALSVDECGTGTCPTETTAIALVEHPAIEVNYMAFNNEGIKKTKPYDFKIQDASKHMLIGPLMLADTPIFRRDPDTGEEYYVTFDSESITNCMKNFANRGYQKNINIQHNDSDKVEGAYLLEGWQVVDPKIDKSAAYGFKNITKGSWFGIIYCPNEEIWQSYITTGVLKGFSVEGVYAQSTKPIDSASKFNSDLPKLTKEEEEIIDELTRILLTI